MTLKTSERILVTVRTYPHPSESYLETVCTGGITDTGHWRRLYPVSLRYLPQDQQFKIWDIIKVSVRPALRDNRPESRRPDCATLEVVDTIKGLDAKRDWINDTIFPSLQSMQNNGNTIAPVSVQEVLDLVTKKDSAEWDTKRRERLERLYLFDKRLHLEKIPYKFYFIWRDQDGEEHKSSVNSWEMAQTWRNYRRDYDDPIAKMKEKLLGDYFGSKRSPSFFMGNNSRFRNTFMVCGWFIPPREDSENDNLWANNSTS